MSKELASFEDLKSRIYTLRGVRVMLDRDLAELYQVKPIVLRQQVKRNLKRFPTDFMFQLSETEAENMVSQNVIPSIKHLGGSFPYAFTEQGVAMLSGILRSDIAVEINIRIMRAFVELRQIIAAQPEYALLKETVGRIESRMDTIEANHLVDHMLISGKVTQLSKDVQDIRNDIRHISELFDQFQSAHIIIKRPDEGLNEG
ncbi:MAG: ORF6N domain-containing protein [Candidatus Margulisiibacteriota bacterium]